jgi:hypothetical protein
MSLNCSNSTVTYSESAKGFPSFYSFIPEYMIGMNSFFYSFKEGNLWRHNTNPVRNNFYGEQHKSTITSVFNPQPTQAIKLFKTLSYESTTTVDNQANAAWSCTYLKTDLTDGNPGSMLSTYFQQKEGEWFSYIRTNESTINFKARSANGIGNCTAISGLSDNILLEFNVSVGSIISIGDLVYAANIENGSVVGIPIAAGIVISKNSNSISINATPTQNYTVPTVGQYIMYIKNAVAESTGARGYYLEFKLENNSSNPVELFSVGSSVMKSNP